MAVPVPENSEIPGEMLSAIQSQDGFTKEDSFHSNLVTVKGHKSYKKRFGPRFMPLKCKKGVLRILQHKLNTGLKKFFYHRPGRKKNKSEEKTSFLETKREKSKKFFTVKNFHCLQGNETDVKSYPDEMEQYREKTVNTQFHGDTADVPVTCQNGQGNVLPFEGKLSDTHQCSWNDSFRDIHFLCSADMDLSSLQNQTDVIVNANVSRTVEADGISYGTTYECDEDDECETMVKEVFTACKQSASIQPEFTTLGRSSSDHIQPCGQEFIAVQCTEKAGDYTPVMPYPVESLIQSEIRDIESSNFEGKRKGCLISKIVREEDRHCHKPHDDNVFQEKSKSNVVMFREPSSETCSCCQAEKSLVELFTLFLLCISWWLDIEKKQKVIGGEYKLNPHTDTESGKSPKHSKTNDDMKSKEPSLLEDSYLNQPTRRLFKRTNSLENFIFQRSKAVKSSKNDRRLDYLHAFRLSARSSLNVFMLPFNHPNSQQTTAESGSDETGQALGARVGRLSSLETPASTVNGHIGVFEQISTGTVTESMKFEWARFKSFWSFPMTCPIQPTVLAKYGFYYTGNEDKVCCFCCGVTHGNWQKGQSVYAMHYQISRRCRFMLGEDVGNVPIHGPYSSLNQRGGGQEASQTAEASELTSQLQTPDSITSILLGRERDPGNPVTTSLVQALPTVPDLRNETRNGLGVGSQNRTETRNGLGVGSQNRTETRNELGVGSQNRTETRNELRVGSQSRTETRNELGVGSAQHCPEMRSGFRSASNLPTPQTSSVSSPSISQSPEPVTQVSNPGQTPAQSGHVSAHQLASAAPNTSTVSQTVASPQSQIATQSQIDTMTNQQRPANQQHPTTLAQRHQEQQQRQTPGAASNLGNLGAATARPRYPNYAVLTVRSSTFNGFPNHLDQTPLQMAQAGFFYAGYGDYVRCFFCGGGLRNWEPGDDPWVEHARWFPRCAYVKQNKGLTFINMVLQRQRELTLPNEYIRTTSGASSTASTATTQTARIMDNQTGSVRETPSVTGPTTTSTASTESPETGPTTTQQQTEIQPIVTVEEMKSPAVLSIREMGYSDEVIKNAIRQLRRNQGPVPLSAEVLVEIIFGFGEDLTPQGPDQTQTGPNSVPATQGPDQTQTGPNSVPATQGPDQTQTGPNSVPATQGPDQTQTGPNSVPATQTETPPSNANPSLGNRTPEPQMGAALPDPRPPRRLRDGDSSTRAYTEEELKSIQEENNQLKEQMKCKICMDNIVCISFLPCGHLCCCAECAPAMVKCPICRQIIRGSVKTYLS